MMKLLSLTTTLFLLLAPLVDARLGDKINDDERDLQKRASSISSSPSWPITNPNRGDDLLDEKDMCRVLVGFKNDNGRSVVKKTSSRWFKELKNIKASSMFMPCASVEELRSNPDIDYVEEDGLVASDAETVPFGISMVLGDSSIIPAPKTRASASSACNDPNSFKVAIIDSGLEASHPDIPCGDINAVDTNCKGISIGVDVPWYAPTNLAWHGTHVFGTIGAIGGNGQGVAGMIPDSDGICYLIARVFDDDNVQQYASKVFEAIDWAISEKANVINMSLGGLPNYRTGQVSFDTAYANGALAVASAGNNGSSELRFPAAYDNVLGVGAVNTDGKKAYFSQYNEKVDLTAPGVSVLSTSLNGGYASSSGTSMAAPAVTGAIAKVWSVCQQCSNVQVKKCMLDTATGTPTGQRTNELGFGIVNAEATYQCLVDTDGCCARETPQVGLITLSDKQVIQRPASSPSFSGAQNVVQRPAIADETQCFRRPVRGYCRRDSQCCSDKCSATFRCLA
jgi:serine protease